jgi:hypothetical protein
LSFSLRIRATSGFDTSQEKNIVNGIAPWINSLRGEREKARSTGERKSECGASVARAA